MTHVDRHGLFLTGFPFGTNHKNPILTCPASVNRAYLELFIQSQHVKQGFGKHFKKFDFTESP